LVEKAIELRAILVVLLTKCSSLGIRGRLRHGSIKGREARTSDEKYQSESANHSRAFPARVASDAVAFRNRVEQLLLRSWRTRTPGFWLRLRRAAFLAMQGFSDGPWIPRCHSQER
jgi:hypothetical protein